MQTKMQMPAGRAEKECPASSIYINDHPPVSVVNNIKSTNNYIIDKASSYSKMYL